MNSKSTDDLILDDDETKILGVKWNEKTDEFRIAVKKLQKPIKCTKRAILSEISRIYDPQGLLAGLVVVVKMLMQKIWRLDTNWDDGMPDNIKTEWIKFYSSLPLLSNFKLKRWLHTNAKSKL